MQVVKLFKEADSGAIDDDEENELIKDFLDESGFHFYSVEFNEKEDCFEISVLLKPYAEKIAGHFEADSKFSSVSIIEE